MEEDIPNYLPTVMFRGTHYEYLDRLKFFGNSKETFYFKFKVN